LGHPSNKQQSGEEDGDDDALHGNTSMEQRALQQTSRLTCTPH
jgi:hypothetical protein